MNIAANKDIHELTRSLGFALCGVCDARPSEYGDALRAWLDAGKHGEMAWLADHVQTRIDPGRLLEGARSIIMVADRIPEPQCDDSDARTGRVACYAQVTDYHKVIKKRLFALADALGEQFPGEQFRACVDTAPLAEREHAMRAGLGWVGKHTLLLNETMGSHLLLGGLVTTLHIEADHPTPTHCGTCSRCIDACPTEAITPWSVDATRCISYLTIEHRSAIDPALFEPIGKWLFGCDICQNVCPFVAKSESQSSPGQAAYARLAGSFDLLQVLGWDEDARREAFIGSAMKRAKLDMIRRNALIVAANRYRQTGNVALLECIQSITADTDEPELVRQTAQAVLNQLDADDR